MYGETWIEHLESERARREALKRARDAMVKMKAEGVRRDRLHAIAMVLVQRIDYQAADKDGMFTELTALADDVLKALGE